MILFNRKNWNSKFSKKMGNKKITLVD